MLMGYRVRGGVLEMQCDVGRDGKRRLIGLVTTSASPTSFWHACAGSGEAEGRGRKKREASWQRQKRNKRREGEGGGGGKNDPTHPGQLLHLSGLLQAFKGVLLGLLGLEKERAVVVFHRD